MGECRHSNGVKFNCGADSSSADGLWWRSAQLFKVLKASGEVTRGSSNPSPSPPSLQDSGVLCDGAEGREDRGGGRAAARLHRGGQLPVDEPRAAGTWTPELFLWNDADSPDTAAD